MVQFYFLSVCLNILGGLVLAAPHFSERFPGILSLRGYIFDKSGLRIGLIAALLLIGVMKIISVSNGDVIIVGDLLPSLTLLLSGFTLLVEFIFENKESESGFLKKMDSIFVKHASITGIAALVAGGLHFIFPTVLFL
ncbi:MAG: hypothetical protein KAR21_20180 [Spirochaetales bacterium]|nr:hypothetical protein [Spirochaetales bacterium]